MGRHLPRGIPFSWESQVGRGKTSQPPAAAAPGRGVVPGSTPALDTVGPGIVGTQDQHDGLSKVEARMQWPWADPAGSPSGGPETRY